MPDELRKVRSLYMAVFSLTFHSAWTVLLNEIILLLYSAYLVFGSKELAWGSWIAWIAAMNADIQNLQKVSLKLAY